MSDPLAAALDRLIPFSVRLTPRQVAYMRERAAAESAARGEAVSWQDLLREACHKTYPVPVGYQPQHTASVTPR